MNTPIQKMLFDIFGEKYWRWYLIIHLVFVIVLLNNILERKLRKNMFIKLIDQTFLV